MRGTRIGWSMLLASCAGPAGGPLAQITAPEDGVYVEWGVDVEFIGLATHDTEDSSDLFATWTSGEDGLLYEETPDATGYTGFVTDELTGGVHLITLSVTDSAERESVVSVIVTVEGSVGAPEVEIVAPSADTEFVEGETIGFTAQVTASDVETHKLLMRVVTDRDGEVCSDVPSTEGLSTCDGTLSVGSHNVVFEVTDPSGETGTATVFVEVFSLDALDQDGDGYTGLTGDCDDNNADVNPGAPEVENGIDDNCDFTIDEGTPAFDDDGDGFSEQAGDCDDEDAEVSPGLGELCDGIDNDCDGDIDEDNADDCVEYWFDLDADNFGDKLTAPLCMCEADGLWNAVTGADCDDTDPRVYPGQLDFYGYATASGNFDWNCDGVDEPLLTDEYSCGVAGGVCLGWEAGWVDLAPDCAWWGDWGEGCGAEPGACWPESVTFTQQTCR